MVDYNLLKQTIEESGLKRDYIASQIGVSRYTLYRKLQGVGEFTGGEMWGLKTVLRLNQTMFRRIFFASKSEANSH